MISSRNFNCIQKKETENDHSNADRNRAPIRLKRFDEIEKSGLNFMGEKTTAFIGAEIFDGHRRYTSSALMERVGRVEGIVPVSELPSGCEIFEFDGGLITAGFVDLQVNGGGGVMLNNLPSADAIRTICDAHLKFGTTSLLPTLITANRSQTNAAIRAAKDALAQGVVGAIGLHLEGPHLSIARNGAHDSALIRAMETTDCEELCALAGDFPSLMITVAPESVSNDQIAQLNRAGATVSLGHTNADFNTINAAVKSGAICVTHLFNAMSQLENRAPGLVGATLDSDILFAGLIADGIHVDPAVIRIALRAKQGSGQIFLVTDSMSTIGTDVSEFVLNDRKIYRREGRLTLADGTLAGADLTMISAVQFMVEQIHIDLDEALRMASLYPAQLLNREREIGSLVSGAQADFIHLDDQCQIMSVWRGNNCVVGAD